jgi:hypothetical protein
MTTIRAQQLETLRERCDKRFSSRLFATFRGLRCFAKCGDEELLRRIDAGIVRGRSYGLTWEWSIATFVGWTLLFGSRFDSHPRIRHFLTLTEVSPDERVALVNDVIPPDEWHKLRALSEDAI